MSDNDDFAEKAARLQRYWSEAVDVHAAERGRVFRPAWVAHDSDGELDDNAAELLAATGADVAATNVLDPDGHQHFIGRATSPGTQIGRTADRNVGLCFNVAERDRPIVVIDADDDPAFCGNPFVKDARFRGYAAVPVRYLGVTVATRTIATHEPLHWEPRDIVRLLEAGVPAVEQILADRGRWPAPVC